MAIQETYNPNQQNVIRQRQLERQGRVDRHYRLEAEKKRLERSEELEKNKEAMERLYDLIKKCSEENNVYDGDLFKWMIRLIKLRNEYLIACVEGKRKDKDNQLEKQLEKILEGIEL